MLLAAAAKCRNPSALSLRQRLRYISSHMNNEVNALVFDAGLIGVSPNDANNVLSDVSVAVKDNICTVDMPTTCSSRMLVDFKSPFDATVVKSLRDAGATIIGKANCDEFGMGSLNIYSIHGPVVNPYKTSSDGKVDLEKRSAGGSSGGSAAAVAAGMCDVALGTDTGGSIRLPASYCDVVGFKPSYGMLSRWGVVSYADSLDCVGLIGKNVDLTKRTFVALAHHDNKDPTSARPEVREKAAAECKKLTFPLRIGIPQEYFPTEMDHSILHPLRSVISALEREGIFIRPVSLPSTCYALSAYYVIASAEASSNLARYEGIEYGLRIDPPPAASKTKTADVYAHSRSAGFGPEVKRRILLGTYALTADAFDNYFLQAQRVRNLVREDFNRVFRQKNVLSKGSTGNDDGVDVLLHPSAIRTAPLLPQDNPGESAQAQDRLSSYVQDVLTVPASLAGLPAVSVPAGSGEDGWPVGVSVVGQWGCDELVLRIAALVEAGGRS